MQQAGSASVRLPTQNELFAYFMLLCGHHHIKKPPRVIAALLDEDEASRASRLAREANDLRVTPSQVVEAQQDTTSSMQMRSSVVALASRTSVPLLAFAQASHLVTSNETKLHLGNRGVVVWLMLVAQCPLMEEVDLSVMTSLYAADAFRTNISGNSVIDVLCEVVEHHPSLKKIDLRGHPIGTVPGRRLLSLAQANPRVVEVLVDADGVDHFVVEQLKSQLARNAANAAQLPAPALPTTLSSELTSLQWVDRKTSRERQALRNILSDIKAFASCSQEEVDTLVNHADRLSLEQVVKDSAGLRGDREHMFIIDSGSLEVALSNTPFHLSRGNYFGYAYHSAMFSAGVISEKERGYAFRVPLEVCSALIQRWEASVELWLPLLRESILLQGAHVWMLMRACHTASIVEGSSLPSDVSATDSVSPSDVCTPRGKPFVGLFVVVQGQYETIAFHPDGTENRRSASSPWRHEHRSETQEKNAGALMTTRSINLLDQYKASEERMQAEKQLAAVAGTLHTASSAVVSDAASGLNLKRTKALGGFTFGPGDVFGEEPLTLRRVATYATAIRAVAKSDDKARCVLLEPEGSAPIILAMKHTMSITTRLYSQALE